MAEPKVMIQSTVTRDWSRLTLQQLQMEIDELMRAGVPLGTIPARGQTKQELMGEVYLRWEREA